MSDKDKNKPTSSSGLIIDDREDHTIRTRLSYIWRLLWRDKAGLIGLTVILVIIFAALLAPLISPHDPLQQDLLVSRQPPAWTEEGTVEHILGTDNLGRDIFSRIIYGSRVSIMVGFLGVSMAFTLGIIIGLIASR